MGRRKWIGAIAVAATCALVGAAGGIASSGAASKSSSSGTTASSAASKKGGGPGGPGGPHGDGGMSIHSVSVQLDKAGTAFITVTRDQGTVTAISGSDITLKEGTKTVTYKTVDVTVADGATVTRNDATAALTDIKVGDSVSIEQSSDGSQVRAYDPTYTRAAPTGGRGGPGGGHGAPPPATAAG
jgi:hypothetical protein